MVFIIIDKTGGLPSFCPMYIGFNVFGANEFEEVVKLVGLYGQVAVVGGEVGGVADDEAFAACFACFRVVAAEFACGLHAVCPCCAQIGGQPLRQGGIFIGVFLGKVGKRLHDGKFGNCGEIEQLGIEFDFFPRQPVPATSDGKQVKIAFQLRIGDGVDAVHVFAEKFEVAQVVFDVLPALQQRFGR